MITDSFDLSKPIITPENFCKKSEHLCDTCIVTFSYKILNHVISSFACQKVGIIDKIAGESPVYLFESNGTKLAIYMSRVGAPPASMDLLVAQRLTGATNFIIFGSAGNLNPELTKGKYVIPSQAYRDEGLSYHYAPATDYINIKNSNFVASVFSDLNIPFVQGKVWTTDAFFMETEKLYNQHKDEGCLAVDMETSGLQAVCDYYGYNLFVFLETGDVLSPAFYDKADLAKANHQLDKFYIALEIAKKIPAGN